MEFAEYNEDYGRNEFGNQVEKEMTQMAALQSLLLGNELTTEEVPLIREFKSVQEFLDLPINDKKEAVLKKLFSVSIVLANKKGVLPFEMPQSPEEIAGTVDDALTRLKVAYQTGGDKLDSIEAMDALVDRLAVRTMVMTDRVIEKGVPLVLDKVCIVLAKHPSTIALVPIIKGAERHITVATKVVAHKGIRRLAEVAKPVVRKVVLKAKSVVNTVFNFLKA